MVGAYAGDRDAYGNPLAVTEMALADELAAAADLAKGKLAGRPRRGDPRTRPPWSATPARAPAVLVRPPIEDMFAFGSRESVLAAALAAVGRLDAYEELVALDGRAGRPRHPVVGAEGSAAALLRGCCPPALETPATARPG